MARDEEPEALIGQEIGGKYRVEELLGRGGMGAVYRAINQQIGKRVALKFLTAEAARDGEAVARFLREAQAASAAESPYIVQIFDAGTTEAGIPYLVMEYLQGEDLRAVLKRDQRLPVAEVLRLLAQIAKALVRAHEAGIVHRDLKPDNVFLVGGEDETQVKLVDFGISKIKSTGLGDKTLTRRGTVLGTPYYMSPEQAQALDLDGRADLYSVGSMVYEALTGDPPFNGPTYEAVLVAICTRDAPDVREKNPGVPPAVAEIVARLLARDPEHRFASARTLLAALAELDKNLSIPSMHPRVAARVPSVELAFDLAATKKAQQKRFSPTLPILAGVLVAALGITAFAVFGNGGFNVMGASAGASLASAEGSHPRPQRRARLAASANPTTTAASSLPNAPSPPSEPSAEAVASQAAVPPPATPSMAAPPSPPGGHGGPPSGSAIAPGPKPTGPAPRPSAGPKPKPPGKPGGLELQTDP